jgi:hypothetical protein
MASTKSFVNNFNNLSQEEKLEFKSLNNYVKQLEKCMATLRNNGQVKVAIVKRVTKSAPSSQETASAAVTTAPVVVSAPVVEAVSTATVAKGKGGKPRKVVSAKEESSPTAQVVQEVQAEAKQAAPVVAKGGKGKGKQAVEVAVKEVVAAAAAPVQKQAAKKTVAKKSA